MKESQLDNKTAIATNDYVRMVDENGNSVKIKKDSFMAAIRDALPSIISDGETGGGSVLSIINGTLKTRTDANLASVLGVPVLPQNTCTSTIISSSSYYTQKVVCSSNRGCGIILFHNNSGGEGIIEFVFSASQTMQAKLIINRGTSTFIPDLYYDGDKTIAVVAKQNWGSWTLISSSNVPPTGTVDSDLTGFTQVAIQNTPALDYGSLGDLASALGAFANAVTLSNNVTWDSLTSTCFVQAMGNNGGVPSSMLYGIGLCIVNSTKGIQVYIPNSADLFIYIRQRWDGAWASSWKKVAYTFPQ